VKKTKEKRFGDFKPESAFVKRRLRGKLHPQLRLTVAPSVPMM